MGGMKLITYVVDGKSFTGALTDDNFIVDVSSAGDVLTLMADAGARAAAQTLLANAKDVLRPAYVDIAPPFAPRSFICIGLNYMDHVRETNAQVPARPVVFAKFANAIAGHGDTITWHADATAQVDYEAELGVVIGKPCYRASKEDALSYVGGYACVNDISARDIQNTDSAKQFTLGKTLDGFCPFGPALVTADEIADPQALGIKCILNGEIMQNSTTGQMIFDVATLIAHLSKFMTLMPGDLIATGTPPGVGMSRTPPVWMKDGDVCTIEIESVGALTNTMKVL